MCQVCVSGVYVCVWKGVCGRVYICLNALLIVITARFSFSSAFPARLILCHPATARPIIPLTPI